MLRTMLGGKIHRARVTEARVDYEGSITVDSELLDAAGILEHESVDVWNVTTGARFRTYAMRADAGSGTVCVNGAAAHLATPGDVVIIASFVVLGDAEARAWRPRAVFVDERNAIREVRSETVSAQSPVEDVATRA